MPDAPDGDADELRAPVFGVGLGKTGTKTLRHLLVEWGYRHEMRYEETFRLYAEGDIEGLARLATECDSFDDWPWPLVYREMDAAFPDARFVLTVRKDADAWYRSYCKMAVRIGPLREYDEPIYGWAMPHGHRQEFVERYERHNREVREYFADQPDKLLEICWEHESSTERLADFLGCPTVPEIPHANRSDRVYAGDVRWIAEVNRVAYQTFVAVKRCFRPLRRWIPAKG